LCGGLGTRLREETEYRPKPMVEVGGRPVLWHIMKIYSHYGFNDFVLCLGYKGHVIREFFLGYHAANSDFTIQLGAKPKVTYYGREEIENWRVTLADTGPETMTGARVARVAKHLGDTTFLCTYGDGLGSVNIRELLAFHRSHGKLATVTGVRPPSRFGEMRIRAGQVVEFREKPQQISAGLINGGFFVFEPDFLRYLSTDTGCILEQEPLRRCAKDGQLMVYPHDGFWQPMDTFREYELLNKLWAGGQAPWRVWKK
ncbi:MAG: glucose-1-phosphate cytidylyltransferase, partial [Verrucomicrobia bacterium]|nr:glucose-1-phosphate cytidylyltransferase [Verrucomicrobiota bacterium]